MDLGLSERDRAVLDFERHWAARGGAGRSGKKDAEIRLALGLSPARYYQILFALIEEPAALRHDPLLVRRLQRLRDSRLRARRARMLGAAWALPRQDD